MDLPGWALGVGIGAGAVYAVARDLVPLVTRRFNGTKAQTDSAALMELGHIRQALTTHFKEDAEQGIHIREINMMMKKTLAEVGGVADKVRELHAWHNVRDDDNVPVWYIRRSLERALTDMTNAVKRLAEKLDKR